MTVDRLIRLGPHLPSGLSEIYFHPATEADATITRLMPDYEHSAELRTLLDPAVALAFPNRVTYDRPLGGATG